VAQPGPLTELIGVAARAGIRGPWLFDHTVLLLSGRAAALMPLLRYNGQGRPSLPDDVCTVARAVLDSLEGFAELRAPADSRAALCSVAELFVTAVAEWVFDTERRVACDGAPSTAQALRASWNAVEVRILLDIRRCLASAEQPRL
jgi:hypothetical protein